jgi:hypothetical protein
MTDAGAISRLLGVAILVAAAGCMRKSATWLDASATADRPVIGLARERHGTEAVFHLNYVAVRSCYRGDRPQKTFWQVRGELPPDTSVPTLITYGVAPAGFKTEVSPERLIGGCYVEMVSGNGISSSVRFTITSDHLIREERSGS